MRVYFLERNFMSFNASLVTTAEAISNEDFDKALENPKYQSHSPFSIGDFLFQYLQAKFEADLSILNTSQFSVDKNKGFVQLFLKAKNRTSEEKNYIHAYLEFGCIQDTSRLSVVVFSDKELQDIRNESLRGLEKGRGEEMVAKIILGAQHLSRK